MKIDNKIKGIQNKDSVLKFLNRFGWLTSQMIASLVWPESNQSLVLSNRMLIKLLDEKLVTKRQLDDGLYCFCLSAQGAKYLIKKFNINSTSGAKQKIKNHVHRACSNWHLIESIKNGNEVYTEHEIQSGKLPFYIYDEKIPDGLIITEYGCIWVEVENSWKNRTERKKIVDFILKNIPKTSIEKMKEISEDLYLLRVDIVSANVEALKSILKSIKEFEDSEKITENQMQGIELHYTPQKKCLPFGAKIIGNYWFDISNSL